MSSNLIPLKNNLKNVSDLSNLKQMVICKVQSLPNYQTLKNDVELILYACNVLENAHADLKCAKTNKRQLIVSVFTELFNLNDEEQLLLNNTVQFLYDNRKIKQVKQVYVVANAFKNWLIKKFA